MALLKHSDYSKKLIIADASALIELHKLGKMDYLHELFDSVFTTEAVKKECKIELPEWITVENPSEDTKRLFRKVGFEKGELTAVSLAHDKNVISKNSSCVILDDKPARKLLSRNKFDIEYIGLLQVMNFAFQKSIFNKDYIPKLVLEMKSHGFRMPKDACSIIYGKEYNEGIKR